MQLQRRLTAPRRLVDRPLVEVEEREVAQG